MASHVFLVDIDFDPEDAEKYFHKLARVAREAAPEYHGGLTISRELTEEIGVDEDDEE
jgi:hypothetical protein